MHPASSRNHPLLPQPWGGGALPHPHAPPTGPVHGSSPQSAPAGGACERRLPAVLAGSLLGTWDREIAGHGLKNGPGRPPPPLTPLPNCSQVYPRSPEAGEYRQVLTRASGCAMYAAVPPIYGGPPAEAPVAAAAAPTGPPLSAAQQRLAALKSKLSEARGKNHKEVVEEDRRNKIGPEALQKERAQANYEKQKKAGLLPSEMDKMMGATAEATEERLKKEDKKEKHRVQYGWDVFNNEAQHRNYKKRVRRGGEEGKLDTGGGEAEVVDEDPDPLAYGEAPPVPRERVQALVEDMHEGEAQRIQTLVRCAWRSPLESRATRPLAMLHKLASGLAERHLVTLVLSGVRPMCDSGAAADEMEPTAHVPRRARRHIHQQAERGEAHHYADRVPSYPLSPRRLPFPRTPPCPIASHSMPSRSIPPHPPASCQSHSTHMPLPPIQVYNKKIERAFDPYTAEIKANLERGTAL